MGKSHQLYAFVGETIENAAHVLRGVIAEGQEFAEIQYNGGYFDGNYRRPTSHQLAAAHLLLAAFAFSHEELCGTFGEAATEREAAQAQLNAELGQGLKIQGAAYIVDGTIIGWLRIYR